jgi:hypothetical protein
MVSLLIASCSIRTNSDGSLTSELEIESPRYLQAFGASHSGEVLICSFNIKFLGFYGSKEFAQLANLIGNCDIVVVQELVSTPIDMPHLLSDAGSPLTSDQDARAFFDVMGRLGFRYKLSEEDTGPNRNHLNNTESEWFVAFYKTEKVELITESSKFISEPLVRHPIYPRVPYAFGFRAKTARGEIMNDFVLISCHMTADSSGDTTHDDRQRELMSIKNWILSQQRVSSERDYIVLGDMNIQNQLELRSFLDVAPQEAVLWSLNWRGVGTNLRKRKPYEQILFNPHHTTEIQPIMEIVDITGVWDIDSFPTHGKFAESYSDHLPVGFRLKIVDDDD